MIYLTHIIAILMILGSLWASFKLFKITKDFHIDLRYGELHSPHTETRSFKVFEDVYYKGERWVVGSWSRHYGQESFYLELIQYNGCHKTSVESTDSRKVKKIIKYYAEISND